MNTQFKKGVLELIALLILSKKDMYGYELVEEISKAVSVKDGTVYPLLKRLTNEKYFDTYLVESKEGPSRKYYKITSLGKKRAKELKKEWEEFSSSIKKFIKESDINE